MDSHVFHMLIASIAHRNPLIIWAPGISSNIEPTVRVAPPGSVEPEYRLRRTTVPKGSFKWQVHPSRTTWYLCVRFEQACFVGSFQLLFPPKEESCAKNVPETFKRTAENTYLKSEDGNWSKPVLDGTGVTAVRVLCCELAWTVLSCVTVLCVVPLMLLEDTERTTQSIIGFGPGLLVKDHPWPNQTELKLHRVTTVRFGPQKIQNGWDPGPHTQP